MASESESDAAAALPPRTPWPDGFAPVIVHTETVLRDHHPAYAAAKAGDADAALTLAEDLLAAEPTERLRALIAGRAPILLPITALETTGFNAIPDAMAQILARELGLTVSAGEIVQNNTVGHTRAKAFNRLVTPAAFEGPVIEGADYVLVDDHVGVGGTLANLKGYVEAHGGRVIGMTTLTQSRDADQIALRPETLAVLREKHGEDLDTFWQEQFGHGLDCLTDVEGQILGREPDLAAIRDRLAQAAVEARGRGVEPAVDPGG
ncbi:MULTISPECIES: phosphoribosyltransferase [unclassified Phenylobacterium]|uniref:phosphoribosyltransferase n=1 Tax=unclassified Phenylobacterium TaxID=2640670 RepID=UPI00083B465D|nr:MULTISPECIES: phosphoribosyltransferase [unclassified Phenylobacterium]